MLHLCDEPGRPLALAGSLTIYEVGQACAALREAVAGARLEVAGQWPLDLSRLDEIDTAGVQLLLALRTQLQRHGAVLALHAPSEAVRELVDLLRLHAALPYAATAAQPEA